MRLRSLEIQGFKSFPDKTMLGFHDGITAVVGPNGSGKSNIADAVRWVLGEQSTKTLRGGKMEDVIFGGTQSRRPQGYAQVQIIIENTDRALLCDCDEVAICRKLYRSGESEYRINGAAVRLKDVYELFMDTGLGRDGYSIIGQGKISEIVSAKSTQRREIFEEAAGISKFRYRKLEAQRRLEGAEENLLRLKDILLELEGRVEPLRVQAEKAVQFLNYAQEKKSLEISLWVTTLDRSKAVLREQEDKLLLCKNDHDTIQEELDAIEASITALYADMQKLAVEMDERRIRSRELEELNAKNGADVAVLRNDISHNEASTARIQAELAQSGVTDGELCGRIRTYEEQIAAREAERGVLTAQASGFTRELETLSGEQNACLERIDALKERRYALTQNSNEVKLSSASSGTLIDESISRLETLKENAVIKDENITRIKREAADCEELLESIGEVILQLQNAQSGYRMKLQSRREKLQSLSRDCQNWEDKARERLQRAKLLFDMENSMEGFQSSVKYVMAQSMKGALADVYGPVSRLVTVDERYALAVEIALGAGMQNIAVKDEAVAKRAIGMLKNAKAGRATFLPLTTVRGNRLTENWLPEMEGFVGIAADLVRCEERFGGIVNQLLGRIAVAEDLDCATAIAKRGGYRFRIVTLDGQVVNTGGSMTGGYAARSAGILSRARDIEALKVQAREYEEQAAAVQAQIKLLQEEISAAEATASGVAGELTTAQEDKIRYEAQLHQLQVARADAVKSREQAAAEYDLLSARLEELRLKNVTNEELTADLNAQLEEVAEALLGLTAQRDDGRAGVQALSAHRSESELKAMTLAKEIDGLRLVVEQLTEQKNHQKEHVDELERQIAELNDQTGQLAQKIAEAEVRRAEYAAEVETLEREIVELGERRNACEAKATAQRAGEKEITARRETVGRELARLEEKKVALQNEYDSIIARLWDEYEITRTQAVELAQPVEDPSGAQRRLAELKNQIKALGNVNVGAVEEYKEVSERYNFLKGQIDDVEKSRAELLRLIDQLTGDMQTIFADNFRKIAQNFSKIFVELFGGGRAELTLSDPGNVLESGIDIFVQPPGKIIKNLASLSGGEQSFVAIAIYFAILKVRPSPFCLLDEIEAALDDVNVVKYAQYLRTICDKTQFITITHRRGTMEEADVLYGVTMQEEGVSKLLELHVSEVEQKLGIK